ncbi:serine proteinase stubble isoform X2 [Leptinotarsa decemlineata]
MVSSPGAANSSKKREQAFQISPKPCWVDGQEGTCMFVYECIKSEGYHIGMCVDTFMFGSCCAHNATDNTVMPHLLNRPHVLYTHPSQNSHHSNNNPSKPPSHYSTSKPKPASRPQATNYSTRPPVGSSLQTVAPSLSDKVGVSSRLPTQPPRHSIRPMSTDNFPVSNSIMIFTKPGWQMTTEPAFITSNHNSINHGDELNLQWQFTTESGSVTRGKKPTKPKNKPTKKPLQGIPDKYTMKYGVKTTWPTSTKRPPNASKPQGHTPISTEKVTATPDLSQPSISTSATMPPSPSSVSEQIDCGMPQMFTKPQTRIVGGKNALFGRWPWQVSVRRTSFFGFSSTHRCGGAILNENWIATAGHCVDDLLTSQIRIRVGEYDFSSVQETLPYTERGVAKKVVHPKYNYFTYEYDLALVRVDKPFEYQPHISPICLPASDDLLIGENATVTGWGRLSEGGTLPSILQEVQVPIVSNDRCKSMFLRAGRHESIPDIFLCAGHDGGGQDSCQGDSGGPLQVKGRDGRYFLAGIISWGIGCAEANLPGVCTRISKFVPWILKNVT